MLRTLFFDLDGTLVDTEVLAVRALQESCEAWSLPLGEEDLRAIVGRTWESVLADVFRRFPPPLDPSEASAQVRGRYRSLVERELEPIEGVREAVELLAREFRVFVVSGSGRDEIERALTKTGLHRSIRDFLGVEDYGESKPSPVPYLEAMKRFGATAGETVVFEDSGAGVASARAARLRVIAVDGCHHFSENVSRATSRIESVARVNPAWLRTWDAEHPHS